MALFDITNIRVGNQTILRVYIGTVMLQGNTTISIDGKLILIDGLAIKF
jgi:hypothetical protein